MLRIIMEIPLYHKLTDPNLAAILNEETSLLLKATFLYSCSNTVRTKTVLASTSVAYFSFSFFLQRAGADKELSATCVSAECNIVIMVFPLFFLFLLLFNRQEILPLWYYFISVFVLLWLFVLWFLKSSTFTYKELLFPVILFISTILSARVCKEDIHER